MTGLSQLEYTYRVTALVSVYKAERFMRACLEDLVRQTLFSETEVIVIDACSPEGEGAIVQEFQALYPNIVYVRTKVREPLYTAWNLAIGMARGRYLTNANADDRHHPACFERLAQTLDAHPEAAMAYGNQRITNEENALFETAPVTGYHHWREYDHFNLMRRCEVGSQPMWRASLHKELGLFDDGLKVVGDLDFWLRVSEKYPLLHVPEELGLYLSYGGNLETANRQRTYEEERAVKEAAIRRFLCPDFVWREPLEPLLAMHSRILSHIFGKLQKEQRVDLLTLEYHLYAYALLAAKEGEVPKALEVLELFFKICNESKNMVHLYRVLLLTSPGHTAGVRVEVPAVEPPPLVSVVVPLYNQGRYLEEAVHSVLCQTEPRWEMVIVNDGSTDESLPLAKALLARYADPRIRLVSQANAGKGKTRNRGVRETLAPFVCILDADDMLCPSYFAEALNMLEAEPDVGWICPKTLVFGGNNHVTWTWEYDFFASLLQCPAPVTALYRRAMWDAVDGYSEDMIDAEDYEFWIKAGEQGWRGKTMNDVYFVYRHAMQRFGCRPDINVKRKLQYLAKHPWWYKRLSPQETKALCQSLPVMIFPEVFLNEEVMERMRPLCEKREVFHKAVESIKKSCIA